MFILIGCDSRPARDSTQADAAIERLRDIVDSEPYDFDAVRKEADLAETKVRGFPSLEAEVALIRSQILARERRLREMLDELKADIEDPAKRAAARARIDEAAATVSYRMAEADRGELARISEKLRRLTLQGAIDQARAKAAAGDLAGALTAYDDVHALFMKEFDRDCPTPRPDYLALYKAMIAESDQIAERVETPEYEAQTPERDMLSPKERRAWGRAEGTIELSWTGRGLEISGVDTGKKMTGVVDLGLSRRYPWRDIVLDISFTILSGKFEMYLRYWPSKPNFLLTFASNDGYELNKAYQMTIRVKGSKVEMVQRGQNPRTDVMKAAVSRTGGIGFGLGAGAKIVISSCKVKVLR